MSPLEPTTIYLEPAVRRALKIKAAATDQSMSALVNDAVRESLRQPARAGTRRRPRRPSREDAADLAVVRQRRHELSRPLKDVIRDLKRDGLL